LWESQDNILSYWDDMLSFWKDVVKSRDDVLSFRTTSWVMERRSEFQNDVLSFEKTSWVSRRRPEFREDVRSFAFGFFKNSFLFIVSYLYSYASIEPPWWWWLVKWVQKCITLVTVYNFWVIVTCIVASFKIQLF